MTPGKHATQDRAGALNLATGDIRHGRSVRKTHAHFRDLLTLLDHADPTPQITCISEIVEHDSIHQAKAVEQ
jgi:hypothetical protein